VDEKEIKLREALQEALDLLIWIQESSPVALCNDCEEVHECPRPSREFTERLTVILYNF
jgi:hypothetical protein